MSQFEAGYLLLRAQLQDERDLRGKSHGLLGTSLRVQIRCGFFLDPSHGRALVFGHLGSGMIEPSKGFSPLRQ